MDYCDQLLIGRSESIQKTRELIRQVVNSDLNTIISGESGVGKELVAQALHLMSYRRSQPFVKVNCAAIPSELLESELFGYEKGAFTGAITQKMGKFELAHHGTILLDEIGDMPLSLQSKMLQVLQDLQFTRLGGKKDVQVDCWILAATNHELEQDLEENLFRQDLYYRLNIIRISITPLRERPEDIEPLIRHFAAQFSKKDRPSTFEFSDSVMNFLYHYPWPGNVRELKNTIKRLILLGDWDVLRGEMLARQTSCIAAYETTVVSPSSVSNESPERTPAMKTSKNFPPLKEVKKNAIRKAERELINAVLQETGWNRKQAAKILKISYKALLYKIKDLELGPNR